MKLVHICHEVTEDNRHRIVGIDEKDEVQRGDWVDTRELAVLGIYFANANSELPIPYGVFTVKQVPWKSL